MNDFSFGFRILGAFTEKRRLVDWFAAFRGYADCSPEAETDKEAYLSAFTFGVDFRDQIQTTSTTKGFGGPCWAPWLWFDIDDADRPDEALNKARALATFLNRRYQLEFDNWLIFFSGSKGYHLGLPTNLWQPEAGPQFHKTIRCFAEQLSSLAKVEIDPGVYDKVRAFRAPNSRHPKTGLHKRRLSFEELMGNSLEGIRQAAKSPMPFDVPTPAGTNDQAMEDWATAAESVSKQQGGRVLRAAGTLPTDLNRGTMDFIRNGADPGTRSNRLFSAAANLKEFGSSFSLALALLGESAKDSGMAPAEILRQIECGLLHVGAIPPLAPLAQALIPETSKIIPSEGEDVKLSKRLAGIWETPTRVVGALSGIPSKTLENPENQVSLESLEKFRKDYSGPYTRHGDRP